MDGSGYRPGRQTGHGRDGGAQIQCMYAPEFNGHSKSFTLEVK